MTGLRNVNRCTRCLEGEHRLCTGSAGNVGCGCIHAAPVPVPLPPEPLAEAQQDDEPLVGAADRAAAREVVSAWIAVGQSMSPLDLDRLRAGIAAALADRPSADTETLRARVEALEARYRTNGKVRESMGKPAWPINVADDLRDALDGDR